MSGRFDIEDPKRFAFNLRWIPEKVDHGQIYFSWKYWFTDNLSLGLDYRPKTDDAGFLATWRALPETKTRPALIFGTSTDDFDDITSQSVYGTVSKNLGEWQDIAFSPYVGATYIFELGELRPVGGVNLRRGRFSSLFMYSGKDPHMSLSWTWQSGQTVSFVLWGMELPGLAYTMRF